MEWIKVEDKLPIKRPLRFENVLVAKENKVVMEALYNTKTEQFIRWDSKKELNHKVTHWMLLPEPPK